MKRTFTSIYNWLKKQGRASWHFFEKHGNTVANILVIALSIAALYYAHVSYEAGNVQFEKSMERDSLMTFKNDSIYKLQLEYGRPFFSPETKSSFRTEKEGTDWRYIGQISYTNYGKRIATETRFASIVCLVIDETRYSFAYDTTWDPIVNPIPPGKNGLWGYNLNAPDNISFNKLIYIVHVLKFYDSFQDKDYTSVNYFTIRPGRRMAWSSRKEIDHLKYFAWDFQNNKPNLTEKEYEIVSVLFDPEFP